MPDTAALIFPTKDSGDMNPAPAGKVGFDVDTATGMPFVIDEFGNVVFTILSAEEVQDIISILITDSSTIDAVYDDGLNTLTLSVKPTSITTGMLAFDPATQAELDSVIAALVAHEALTTSAHGGILASSMLDTDGTLSANSDAKIPSQKAVKTYADQLIASADAMVFKGVIDCSSNPNYPAADRGWTYRVSVAGKIGGGAGPNVEVGDVLLCLTDGTASGTHAAVGAQWSIAQTNIDGAVVGPAVAVDNDFAQFDGASGKLIKDGGLSFDAGTVATNSAVRVPAQSAVKSYADAVAAAAQAAAIAASQPLDATLTALAGQNWALNSAPLGSGADTVLQQAIAVNQFLARGSTGNYVPKTISDAALAFLAAADAAAETALLNTATTALKGLMSAADKVKLNGIWIDVVAEHGADNTGASDARAAIVAAIAALPSTGGVIYFPRGTYDVSANIDVNKPVIFMGQGRSISVINATAATGNIFTMITGSAGAGFEQIRLSAETAVLRTAGFAVDFGAIANVYMQQCDILFQHSGVHSSGALQFLDDLNIREMGANAANGQCVLIDGTGDRYIRRLTSDNPSDPTGFAGIRVRRCSSLVITDSNIINATNCLDLVPNGGGGTAVASVLSVNTFYDSSVIGLNIVPASNSDTVHRVRMINCWFSTMTQAGVVLGNAAINVANTTAIDFVGCDFYQNPVGIDSFGIDNWGVRSSNFSGNTTAAIRIVQGLQAGIHSFTIFDNFIGNGAGFGANGVGITIAAGTYGDYNVADNRGLSTNTTPGIIDSGSVTVPNEKLVRDNLGTGLNTYETGIGTAGFTFGTATATVTGMSFPIVAPSLRYLFDGFFHINHSATGSTAVGIGVSLPAGAVLEATLSGPTNSSGVRNTYFTLGGTPQNSFITTTGFTVPIRLSGAVIAGTATSHTGTVQVIARAQATATMRQGSWFRAAKY